MSLPFSRSLRSLESDNYRVALIGLLIITPLFVLWLAWFFTGEVALHEASDQIVQTKDGLVAVTFEEGLPPLVNGVDASLRILENGEEGAGRVVTGYVHRFVPYSDGSTVAHIFVEDEAIASAGTLIGEAAIEVDTVSPAEFLWDMVDGDE